jgi:chitinase
MKLITLLVLLTITALATSYDVSMFYCGFSGDFCGQSTTDDINPSVKFVILAFANTNPDGSVTADAANFPTTLVTSWQTRGKKVLISVGGQNGNWPNVFASDTSTRNFVGSLNGIVLQYGLDGVDLDIENYNATPRTFANMILSLRGALGTGKLIVVSPEDVTVLQEVAVPNPDAATGYFNYFVPIIQLADSAIDYYQVQAYNNWYQVPAGSLEYIQNVYLNWRNLQGLMTWGKPIPNFSGVAGNKLLIGLIASTNAGGANYYITPDIISRFKQWLKSHNYPLKGFMMWDSHWDSLNGFLISTACAK